MKDRVEYAMPLGPLGEIAYYLFVARSLEQIFRIQGARARGDYGERVLRSLYQRIIPCAAGGRGDPCTQCEAQSCARRATLLSGR